MVEATSTKIDLASKDHGQSSFQAGSDAMVLDDFSTDSIDPDVEERLYSLIHHAKQQPADGEVIMDDGVISIENNNLPQKQHQAGPANKPSNQVFYAEYSDSDDDTGIENINDGMMIYDSYAGSSIDGNSPEKSTSQDRGSIIRVPGQPDIITLGSSDEEDSGFDQDIWHVDRVDLLIANSLSTERPPRKYCSRCRKKGNHCVKFCHLRPYITCHVCGNLGHMGDTCQNRVCFKCLENHRRGNCPPHSAPYCSICQVRGHPDVECPTHWRKFFNITNSIVSPDVYSVSMNKRKFCAICTLEHFTFECTQRQRAKGLFKNLDGLDISNQLNPSVKRKHPGNTLSSSNKRYRGGFVFQHQDSVSTQYHPRPSMSNFSFLPNMTRKERSLLRTDGFLRGSLNPDNGICFMGNPCYSLRNRQESRLPSSYYRDMRRAWKAKKRAVDFSKKSKKKQKQSSNSATQTQPSSSSSNLNQPTPNASSTIAKIANGVSKKRKKNKGKKKNNNKLQPKSAAQLHSIKPEGSASTSAPKPLFPRTSGLIVID